MTVSAGAVLQVAFPRTPSPAIQGGPGLNISAMHEACKPAAGKIEKGLRDAASTTSALNSAWQDVGDCWSFLLPQACFALLEASMKFPDRPTNLQLMARTCRNRSIRVRRGATFLQPWAVALKTREPRRDLRI